MRPANCGETHLAACPSAAAGRCRSPVAAASPGSRRDRKSLSVPAAKRAAYETRPPAKMVRRRGPFPQFDIGFIGYFSVEAAVSIGRVFGLLAGALGGRGPRLRSLRQRLIGSKLPVLLMPNFSESSRGISVPREVGRHHRLTRFQLQESVDVKHARANGIAPGEHRQTRRIAKRKLAVGLWKTYALPGKAVSVRSRLEDVSAKRCIGSWSEPG